MGTERYTENMVSESSTEAQHVGNQIKGEVPSGVGKRTPVWETKSSRRSFLSGVKKKLIGAGLILGGVGSAGVAAKETGLFSEGSTSEQESAKILFKGPEDRLVEGLVVAGSGAGEEINLRNKPRYSANPEDNVSKVVGKLKEGDEVEKALAVWGNNPDKAGDPSTEAVWYAFPNPNDSEKFVFAYSGLFEPHERPDKVFDLETKSVREAGVN